MADAILAARQGYQVAQEAYAAPAEAADKDDEETEEE